MLTRLSRVTGRQGVQQWRPGRLPLNCRIEVKEFSEKPGTLPLGGGWSAKTGKPYKYGEWNDVIADADDGPQTRADFDLAQQNRQTKFPYDDFPVDENNKFLIFVKYWSGCPECPNCCTLVRVNIVKGNPEVSVKPPVCGGAECEPPDPGPAKKDVDLMFDTWGRRYHIKIDVGSDYDRMRQGQGNQSYFLRANTVSSDPVANDPLMLWDW